MSCVEPSIPTITLSGAPSPEKIHRLRQTCETIGFFYLDVQDDPELVGLLPQVFRRSQEFFSLPLDIKRRISDPTLNRGYTGMGEETLDPAHQSKGDTKEGYYIADDVKEDSPHYNPAKLSGPNVWPTKNLINNNDTSSRSLDCKEWREVMMAYHDKMKQISFKLVRLIAMALDLSHNYFDNDFDHPMAVLRLLHYSRERSDIDRGVYACGAHSDYGMVTLLATDANPGLQINYSTKDDWIDVPPPPIGTFVVNLGDMLERWTNGKFMSTIHRVIIPSQGPEEDEGDSAYCERYSIPFFYEPNFDTVVECLQNCLDNGPNSRPKYPPTTSGQHLLEKYNQTHTDFNSSENIE